MDEILDLFDAYIKSKGGDPSYWIYLSGPEDGQYRADIGYIWTGAWSDTISGALRGLYDELIRVGEIKV